MKASHVSEQDKFYKDLDILRQVNEALAMSKYHRTPIGSQMELNGHEVTVLIPADHVLYDIVLDLHALMQNTARRTESSTQLSRRVYEKCQHIIHFLRDNQKIAMHLDNEDKRWAFFMSCLSQAICSMYTFKLVDVKLFDTRARELFKAIMPHYGTQRRLLTRFWKAQKFDLDVLMGCYYNEHDDTPLAEAYLNKALRNMPTFLEIGGPRYQSAMYVIHNELSEIHFKRGDYLAAEVQYDHATRFISQNVALIAPKSYFDEKIHIVHHKLANHYCAMDQWNDEKRLRTKTVEVCDLFLARTIVGSLHPALKAGAIKIRSDSLQRLNIGSFFNELPRKIRDHVASADPIASQLTMLTSEHYLKLLPVLRTANMLDDKGSHADSFCLKLNIKPNSDIPKFFRDALTALFPQPKKQQKNKKKPAAKQAEPVINIPAEANEVAELEPLQHIATSWKQQQKQTPARQNRGNKPAALPKDRPDSKFFIDQHRPVPPIAFWKDAKFGELTFERNNVHCEVIVMRNEHNCGKPVFGYLPTKAILTKLCQYYHPDEAELILSEIQKTFSEAKQAGFYGRGLKSCTTLPELAGTDYKLVLKPSHDFKPTFRLFGRHITTNTGHTLYILDAINCNPKSAASKIEFLEPPIQLPLEKMDLN